MGHRRFAALSVAVATLATGTVIALPDTAAAHEGLDWQPYRSSPVTYDHGECSFVVTSTPVVDEEEISTVARYPDGSPRLEFYRGALKVRFTHVGTGRSRVVDLSGRAAFSYGADGSQTLVSDGPVSVGFRPGDDYPAGIWRFTGVHAVHTAPQRTDRRVLLDRGGEQNICTLIS